MTVEHERMFVKRLNQLRTSLKKAYPRVSWVEATEPNGDVIFHLTEKVLWNATGGQGTRTITLNRPDCLSCKKPWIEHQPPGGHCLFASTEYDHPP